MALLASCSAGSMDVGEESVADIEEALVDTWIGPVSEEVGSNSATCAQANVGVQQAQCGGKYCDDNYLYCKALPAGVTTFGGGFFSHYISEESPNNLVVCDTLGGMNPNGIVDGIRAQGKYSDLISVHCRETSRPPTNCQWSAYFSEEQRLLDFGVGRFVAGVRCKGSYCDQVSYLTCGF
jgi:hypothetical protein